MLRVAIFTAVPLFILLGMPSLGLAADSDTWPYYKLKHFDDFRGDGHYFSWLKLSVVWLLFLGWVKTTDWVNQDSQGLRIRFKLWIPIIAGTFVAALALFWIASNFALGMSLLAVAYIAPLGAYVGMRNRTVEPEQRVLTPTHLSDWFSSRLHAIGLGGKPKREVVGPRHAVRLRSRCGDNEAANDAISNGATTLPGYDAAGELLSELLAHRADAVMMDVGREEVAMRYLIDGVWHNIAPRTRETVDPILIVVRAICTGDPSGERATARGDFEFELQDVKYVCQVTHQKVEGAIRVILKLETLVCPFDSLESLGMHPKIADVLRERIDDKNQMILFSGLPGGGLSTTIDTVLTGTDRIRRDCVVVESAEKYEREIDATEVYQVASGGSTAETINSVIRSWPDLLVVRGLKDVETTRLLCRQAREECMIVTTIAAKSAVESVVRVLMLKTPPKELAPVLSCVVHQRLIRRLCEHCKEPYEAPAKVLQQLGLPTDRIKTLYRPPQNSEQVCEACRGIGYRGRTALFEMLVIDDAIRELLLGKPSLEGLKTLAEQKGMHSIRDFGAVMAGRGETSVEELSRVLKQ